jgi:hypothetical protein
MQHFMLNYAFLIIVGLVPLGALGTDAVSPIASETASNVDSHPSSTKTTQQNECSLKQALEILENDPKNQPVFLDYTLAKRYDNIRSGIVFRVNALQQLIGLPGKVIFTISDYVAGRLIGEKNNRRLKNLFCLLPSMTGIWTLAHGAILGNIIFEEEEYDRLDAIGTGVICAFLIQILWITMAQDFERNNPYIIAKLKLAQLTQEELKLKQQTLQMEQQTLQMEQETLQMEQETLQMEQETLKLDNHSR